MKEMEKCPFCGAKDFELKKENWNRFFVYCACCEAHGGVGASAEQAIQCWNARAKT